MGLQPLCQHLLHPGAGAGAGGHEGAEGQGSRQQDAGGGAQQLPPCAAGGPFVIGKGLVEHFQPAAAVPGRKLGRRPRFGLFQNIGPVLPDGLDQSAAEQLVTGPFLYRYIPSPPIAPAA